LQCRRRQPRRFQDALVNLAKPHPGRLCLQKSSSREHPDPS